MALTFHPQRGSILFCDFTTGFVEPEMVKKRPIVVISGKHNGGIVSVVPLSTKPPEPKRDWHHLLSSDSLPHCLRKDDNWAKCDMLTAVAITRLDRVMYRSGDGKRNYVSHKVNAADMDAIESGILAALCMKRLTTKLT